MKTRHKPRRWSRVTVGLAAGAAAVFASGATLAYRKFRRRRAPDPAELEQHRRRALSRQGRLASGELLDLVHEPSSLLLVYRYAVAGLTYEVSQDVAKLLDAGGLAGRAIGSSVIVKYDMKQPSNSIVISEEWSGIPGIKPRGAEVIAMPRRVEQRS